MIRKLITPILAVGLIVCLMVPGANAWEFSMDGTFTWEYAYRAQNGTNGFFGAYDQDAGSGITNATAVGFWAPVNFWPGFKMLDGQLRAANTVDQVVSGSDASFNSFYMSTNMQVRMNPAIRIRGNYYIGQWASPTSDVSQGLLIGSQELSMQSHGVQHSFSPGYWNTLWLTAQLPWGEIAVGKRPSSWGMGLSFDGANNRSSESLALAVPYGPIRIQLSFYPARRAQGSAYFNNYYDKNNIRVFDMTIPNVTYTSGPLNLGVIATYVNYHQGGESVLNTPTIRSTTQIPYQWDANTGANTTTGVGYRDFAEWYASAFVKYNNGRFFLNAEVQTDQQKITWLSNNSGPQIGASYHSVNGVWQRRVAGPTYMEHWGGAVEAGVLAGPSKVALLFALMTGNDTRVDANGNRTLITVGVQGDTWSNISVFRPYSYLMAYSYGMGNTAPVTDTREGFVSDASVYAARLDYAVAANLNLFGSFMWAERFSKSGYTWGFVWPGYAGTAVGSTQTAYASINRENSRQTGADAAPSIPDTALGWEIDAGADWKLLEGLALRTTVAYWQPGKWFSYAYQDKSIPGWGRYQNGDIGNNWLTRPDKTIDPVWGLDIRLEGTF